MPKKPINISRPKPVDKNFLARVTKSFGTSSGTKQIMPKKMFKTPPKGSKILNKRYY